MTEWRTANFDEVVDSRGAGSSGLPQVQWSRHGKFPVIGQGADYIEGWTDREDLLIRPEPAFVLYGGHTRRAKYVDRPFVPGPNVKILTPSRQLIAKFLYYYLLQLNIESRGYADHFPHVRRQTVPVPPLEEQRRIVDLLDRVEAVREAHLRSLARIDECFASIQHRTFGARP